MPEYLVKWEMDVYADSPREAALEAAQTMANISIGPNYVDGAVCYDVIDVEADESTFIDLENDIE